MKDSLNIRPPRPEFRNRARELGERAKLHYDTLKERAKEGESVNLVCYIGSDVYDVYSMGDYAGDFITVHSNPKDGPAIFLIAPVEKIAFATIISKSAEPSREIGFHQEMVKGEAK